MSTGISIWVYSSNRAGQGWRFAYVDDGETFEYSGTYNSCLDAINAASDVIAAECGDEADAIHVPSMLAPSIRADLDGCDMRVIGYQPVHPTDERRAETSTGWTSGVRQAPQSGEAPCDDKATYHGGDGCTAIQAAFAGTPGTVRCGLLAASGLVAPSNTTGVRSMTAHERHCQLHIDGYMAILRAWLWARNSGGPRHHRMARLQVTNAVRMVRTWRRIGAMYRQRLGQIRELEDAIDGLEDGSEGRLDAQGELDQVQALADKVRQMANLAYGDLE